MLLNTQIIRYIILVINNRLAYALKLPAKKFCILTCFDSDTKKICHWRQETEIQKRKLLYSWQRWQKHAMKR